MLVDITPQLLIERLKAGKVYAAQSPEIAERAFFRPDTLATLRKISLLEVAEQVEPGRRAEQHKRHAASPKPAPRPVLLAPHPAAEAPARVVALATPDPWMRPTAYHAFRTTERLHAPFDVVWVQTRAADAASVSSMSRRSSGWSTRSVARFWSGKPRTSSQ